MGGATAAQAPARWPPPWLINVNGLRDARKQGDGRRDRRRFLVGWFGDNAQFDLGVGHSGMFPCLRDGVVTRFVRAVSNAWINQGRVSRGWITASMYPREAA